MRRLSSSAPLDAETQGARPSNPQFANTLERGLRVLQCFSANSPALGNGEIAAMTGLPKPTVSRLTYTLVELGYLRRRDDSARFEVGNGVLCLGYPVLARLAFRRVAMPHLRYLAEEIDGAVAIWVRDRLRMVALESVIRRDVFRRKPATGVTIDLVGSTAGLGWVAGATASERDRAMREVAFKAPQDVERMRQEHATAVKQMLKHGYVFHAGALRPNTVALATPMQRRPGDELLVLVCGLEIPPPNANALQQRASELLRETSRRISSELLGP